MAGRRFADRAAAGRRLAGALTRYAGPSLLVLGLPRGGVPVAFEVADTLGAELDAFVVRKVGMPGHEELALGAVASGGTRVVNAEVLARAGVSDERFAELAGEEERALARTEEALRGNRPPPGVEGRPVIIVDDGLATGATMRAALHAVRQLGCAHLVAAAPVGAPATARQLRRVADDVVCLRAPLGFGAVGQWYEDFSPTSDEAVRDLLRRARSGGGSEGG